MSALSIAVEALEEIARLRTDLRGDFSMGSHQSDIARKALSAIGASPAERSVLPWDALLQSKDNPNV